MSKKRIHLYPFQRLPNDNEYWPDEVVLTITGTRTKEYNRNTQEFVLHIPFGLLRYFIGQAGRPYHKVLKALSDIQIDIDDAVKP